MSEGSDDDGGLAVRPAFERREVVTPVSWGRATGEAYRWRPDGTRVPEQRPAEAAPAEPEVPPPPAPPEPAPESAEVPEEPQAASDPAPVGGARRCPNCEATEREAEARVATLLETLEAPLAESAALLAQRARELGMRYGEDVIELASKLAEAIVGRAVELDERLVLESLARVLEVAGPVEKLTVRCHPDDVSLISTQVEERAAFHAGAAVEVRVRPSGDIPRGSVLATFDEGIADGRVSTQLQNLTQAVREAVSLAADEQAPTEGPPEQGEQP